MTERTDQEHRIMSADRLPGMAIAAFLIVAGIGLAVMMADDLYVDIVPDRLGVFAGICATASLAIISLLLFRSRREAQKQFTALAAADAAFRASEQRFRRIFEGSPLGMLLTRGDTHRIVQVNPAFCRMLGYEADELIGRTVDEITHHDDRHLINAGTTTEDPAAVEQRYLKRTGGVNWARVRTTLLRSPDSQQTLELRLIADINRRKQAEAELQQAQKMQAVGQLTGGIAHDFNNLLGVIVGNVEFLLDSVRDNPEQTELAREILNSALGGADLTRRLLAFARRQALQPRRIDLNRYVPDHIAILRRVLGETIQITMTLADDLWPTRADPSQVGDALINLAINARDAMPHGGTMSIETANTHLGEEDADGDCEVTAGDYVVLSVVDTGVGMLPEVLQRALEPFFTTKEPGVGSGLGLSMIYGFAKQSGGHLKIYSEHGHGTTVRLYLPKTAAGGLMEIAAIEDPSVPFGDESVLLVDDNPEMRAVARRHLGALGYRVVEAASGPVALAILRGEARFDLLFTDIVMPDGMTGYQLAAAARQLRPTLRVLFTTGYARVGAGSEPPEQKLGPMLRKPYRQRELATTLRAVLDG